MGGYDKRDYYAFQILWQENAHNYIQAMSLEEQYIIVNKFRDSLVDIALEGKRALRTRFTEWEEKEWIPFCKNALKEWMKEYPFEASDKKAKQDEYEQITKDYNYLRYRKILQLIQDSGIGLGTGGSRGYDVGPKNKSKFTG